MKSWKTFAAGAATTAGGITGLIIGFKKGTLDEVTIPAYITAIITGVGLMFARDNNVSSVDVGIQGVTTNVRGEAVITPVGPKSSEDAAEKIPSLIASTPVQPQHNP